MKDSSEPPETNQTYTSAPDDDLSPLYVWRKNRGITRAQIARYIHTLTGNDELHIIQQICDVEAGICQAVDRNDTRCLFDALYDHGHRDALRVRDLQRDWFERKRAEVGR